MTATQARSNGHSIFSSNSRNNQSSKNSGELSSSQIISDTENADNQSDVRNTMSSFAKRTFAPRLLLIALVAGACGSQAAASVDSAAAPTTNQEAAAQDVGRIINVEVMEATSGDFTEVIRITGSVLANRDVVVSAEEAGVIREVMVDKGARVTAGQPIARIDDKILVAQVAQAKAQSDLATQVYERRQRLYNDDKVGTELAYLEAKANAEQAVANHSVLTERLARTVIRAPIAGVLDTREIELGSMVSPGSPVARIIQLDTVKISGGVPERYALDVKTGTAVRVTFDVLPGRVFSSRIGYSGAAVNPRNRTFPIELSLPNSGLTVKPEMVANIEATRRTVSGAISLPQEALVRVEDGFVVYVVKADASGVERAIATPVKLGLAQQNRVSIEEGLAGGDRVVVVGQNQIAANDRVRIVNTRKAETSGGME